MKLKGCMVALRNIEKMMPDVVTKVCAVNCPHQDAHFIILLQSWNSSSQSGCTNHSRAMKSKRIIEDPEPQFVTGAQVQSGTSSCLPILRCYEVSSINFFPSSQVSSTGRSQRHFALGSLRQHCSAEL